MEGNIAYGKKITVGKKQGPTKKGVSVYSNLARKRQVKKDAKARKKAEYLATLPKHPLKRLLYRLHPKRVAKYWFSRQGLFMFLKIIGVCMLLLVLTGTALISAKISTRSIPTRYRSAYAPQ